MDRLEKAAAFGAMMGKRAGLFGSKFTPNRKLQQALMAEREKLIAEWEEGGTDWSQETHPDTGGNPNFNRRWNKAFNQKEDSDPKEIFTPLYDSKPSWFPFRTQGMIDKARDAEYLRSDNEEAWDTNDWKTEMALRDDHTREGVNNILNHYLDRNHGIVKNPYKTPADLADYSADYKGMVQKSLPWKTTADTDKVNELADETMFPDYKSPANRQKLFDQYYPYLDLAPSANLSKKGPIAKAAAFGAMIGKRAAALTPMALSSLAGAAIGGGGTAIYDWLKGTKENKLRRALIGAGVGGLAGAGLGHLAGKLSPVSKPEPLPTSPKVEKRVSGIGDLKDFGEDSLAASRAKLVDSIGKQDSHHLEIDAIRKGLNEDRDRMGELLYELGGSKKLKESGEYARWLQSNAKGEEALKSIYDIKTRDRASLLDGYNQFRSQSTSNALSKDRDRLLYDRDFVRKALASPADEPEGVFEEFFNGGNIRIKEYGVTNNYPDDGPGRLYYDKLPDDVDFRSFRHSPKTYTPALNYKLGPWEGSGDLTNRFFLPDGREGYHPSGNSEVQEIKTLTSRPGAVK